jgi:predicted HTH transcriptional regulator
MTERDVRALAVAGESETIEFKRSTGQLSGASETLCAFLNARGGQVLFGVGPDSQVSGQSVSDATMQESFVAANPLRESHRCLEHEYSMLSASWCKILE